MAAQKKRRAARNGWLPPPIGRPVSERARPLFDGEPRIRRLVRFPETDSLSSAEVIVCCDCGLKHLQDYRVVRQGKDYALIVRAYRLER